MRAKTASQYSLSSSLVAQMSWPFFPCSSTLETLAGADAKLLMLHLGRLSRAAEAKSEDSPAL